MRSSLAEGPVAIYSTALRYNKKDALALLKNKNVNIQQEQNGFTAIHYASIGGEANVVKILIDAKIDVNAKDNAGFTAIHYASSSSEQEGGDNNFTSIELLLIAGGDPNAVSQNGQTPLHIASKENNAKAISSLLIGGANPNITDKNKRTPLHEVSAIGNFKAVKFLLIANATIDVVDNFGNTPISLAIKAGHDDIVKILQERAKANELTREESGVEISLKPPQAQNSDFLPSEKRITEDELREEFQAEVPLAPKQAFNRFSIYSQLELSETEPESVHCGILDKSDIKKEIPSKKEIPIKFNPMRRTVEVCAEELDYSDLAKKTPARLVASGGKPRASNGITWKIKDVSDNDCASAPLRINPAQIVASGAKTRASNGIIWKIKDVSDNDYASAPIVASGAKTRASMTNDEIFQDKTFSSPELHSKPSAKRVTFAKEVVFKEKEGKRDIILTFN